MRRDFDLIRQILLDVEGENDVELSAYSDDQVNYHKALLIEARLCEGPPPHYSFRTGSEIPGAVLIHRLTWEGHDFLDQARSNKVWEKAKSIIIEKGLDLTLDGLRLVLGQVIKTSLSGLA